MDSNIEEAEDISANLSYVKEQIKMLKQEREKLLKANQELVSLALKMDELLQNRSRSSSTSDIALKDHGYSSNSSWRSNPQGHGSPSDLRSNAKEDIDKIESQILAVREMVQDIQSLKSEEN